ncbi:glutamine synthetase [Labrys miyagiensis]
MAPQTATFEERLAALAAAKVHLGIFDIDGLFRHKLMTAEKASKLARNGYSFCDAIYAWDSAEKTYRDGEAYVDRPCFIDEESLRAFPFSPKAAVAIADFDGPFGSRSPRNQLRRMLDKARQMGFSVLSAFEFEFFLLNETPDSLRDKGFRNLDHFAKANRTYSMQSAILYEEMLEDLQATMATADIGLDSIHTELGPGCFEVPLSADYGIRAADNAALFKNFAKAFFLKRGLTAAFVSKLSSGLSGQSGHLHVSFRTPDDTPAFSDPNTPDGLSRTARHFIGGLVNFMPELLALCSHTVNAYRRMVPGMWAPTSANWGIQNWVCAVRVINDNPEATRIEFRVPSADTNPHAALAMCLGAGLRGIELGIDPPEPIAGAPYGREIDPQSRFPADLPEATARLRESATARLLFGDTFVDHFVLSREKEIEAFRKHVTAYELERYLEIV